MTWEQIRSAAEKQGLSCKQVYELVVAQQPTTNGESAKCQHENFERRQVMDFSYNHCNDCGHEWGR